jgi:hypothetical protein
MAKRRVECAKYHCTDPPFMGGLCRRHHEEDEAKERRRNTALALLDSGRLDNEPLGAGPLREEFYKLQDWWRQVCVYITSSREHPVLRDETRYADSWCIGLAEFIIDEERGRRAGTKVDVPSHQYLRKQLWERFDNLERGLRSNGVERP